MHRAPVAPGASARNESTPRSGAPSSQMYTIHLALRAALARLRIRSRLLRRRRRPVGWFDTELLGILLIEPGPPELHRLAADNAAEGRAAKQVIQYIETNVPAGSTHGDEAAADVDPQR